MRSVIRELSQRGHVFRAIIRPTYAALKLLQFEHRYTDGSSDVFNEYSAFCD